MDEQVLKKKLAEWAGLKDAQIDDLGHPIYRKVVEGKDYGWVRIPKFTDSLDACFKWLTPKVILMLADIDLSTEKEAWYKLVGLWLEEPNPPSALALCLAIEKLIDSEVTNVGTFQE